MEQLATDAGSVAVDVVLGTLGVKVKLQLILNGLCFLFKTEIIFTINVIL